MCFRWKMRDSWVYVGEGIGIYFRIFSSGESMPRGRRLECWRGGVRV